MPGPFTLTRQRPTLVSHGAPQPDRTRQHVAGPGPETRAGSHVCPATGPSVALATAVMHCNKGSASEHADRHPPALE
uniref:Uncharacterized protein n=1 Tax=Ralstonia solanacearum TaxID=305 RepID=A0A0S4TU86_RALSL|nr:protein of unknown function [Ralstonia solanacearum]